MDFYKKEAAPDGVRLLFLIDLLRGVSEVEKKVPF